MGSNPTPSARKSDKFRLVAFSIKSTLMGGINRIHDEFPLPWDEIRLDGGWVDLISSEAVRRRFHPNLFGFHLAKQDFLDNRVSSNPNEKAPKYLFYRPFTKKSKLNKLALFYFSFLSVRLIGRIVQMSRY